MSVAQYHLWFDEISMADIAVVGGKNASLGEMYANLAKANVKIPFGFAITVAAFNDFLANNKLNAHLSKVLQGLDVDDVMALQSAGLSIRQAILQGDFTKTFIADITLAYNRLCERSGPSASFAVRSSATAEDLPGASFAGQQETFLNITGIDDLLVSIKKVYASLFSDRAISYRKRNDFSLDSVGISVGIQQMVRSDLAASGVVFTLDTESGYQGVVYITSSFGLGEGIVSGTINPDEFYVDKRILVQNKPAIIRKVKGSKHTKVIYASDGQGLETTVVPNEERHGYSLLDTDIVKLAKLALSIESHYARPMDIEWAKDGITGEIFILQARPETVESNKDQSLYVEKYVLADKGELLVSGRSVGSKIGNGHAKILENSDNMHQFVAGDVLVTDMTDPDWEPIMKKASAIITNRGGRTCHAAIIARELGIPAVVGTENATAVISDGMPITVSCAAGDEGKVYQGILAFKKLQHNFKAMPDLSTDLLLNIGNPDTAFNSYNLPCQGVGLARLEFIVSNNIGVHPKAITNFMEMPADLKAAIALKTSGYNSPVDFYESKLVQGIATIASTFYPKPVTVRLSDFKSNEYANLLGGNLFEPVEENPMLGFRGASRYNSSEFRECFAMECNAIRFVREQMGLDNVNIMIPFVRTLAQAKSTVDLLKEHGLQRGVNNLVLLMMCELPTNVLLAEDFLTYFDGYSIGSNDLTQLTLGLDRDSGKISSLFDERDPSVKILIKQAIDTCKKLGKYVGICGQAPSDYPEFAKWLVEQQIDSMSLNPDSIVDTAIVIAS